MDIEVILNKEIERKNTGKNNKQQSIYHLYIWLLDYFVT